MSDPIPLRTITPLHRRADPATCARMAQHFEALEIARRPRAPWLGWVLIIGLLFDVAIVALVIRLLT